MAGSFFGPVVLRKEETEFLTHCLADCGIVDGLIHDLFALGAIHPGFLLRQHFSHFLVAGGRKIERLGIDRCFDTRHGDGLAGFEGGLVEFSIGQEDSRADDAIQRKIKIVRVRAGKVLHQRFRFVDLVLVAENEGADQCGAQRGFLVVSEIQGVQQSLGFGVFANLPVGVGEIEEFLRDIAFRQVVKLRIGSIAG